MKDLRIVVGAHINGGPSVLIPGQNFLGPTWALVNSQSPYTFQLKRVCELCLLGWLPL